MTEYTPPVYKHGEVCEHGGLARKCDVCGLRHQLEHANKQLAAEKATVLSLLSTIHDIRVAAKLPISTMLSEIPARIGEIQKDSEFLEGLS